jgi:hypothetical protein
MGLWAHLEGTAPKIYRSEDISRKPCGEMKCLFELNFLIVIIINIIKNN